MHFFLLFSLFIITVVIFLVQTYVVPLIGLGDYLFVLCVVERKGGKKDASGADYRNRKSFPKEADIFAGHSIIETCSPRLLQGQELQAHWFPHPQRFVSSISSF